MKISTIKTLATAVLVFFACTSDVSAQLILHYDFDGQVVDQTGRGNDGTIVGSPEFQLATKDQGLFVDNPVGASASNEFVVLPDTVDIQGLDNSSFTVGIRYRTDDPENSNGRLTGGLNHSLEYNAGARNNVSSSFGSLGAVLNDEGTPLGLATDSEFHWQFLVVDRKTELEVSLFLDGNLLDTDTLNAATPMGFDDYRVGSTGGSTERNRFGARQTLIDEFAVWNSALTASQVQSISNGGSLTAVPEPSSIALMSVIGCGAYLLRRKKNKPLK